MKTLAQAGHEVHVISRFPLKHPIKNYYDVSTVSDEEGIKLKSYESIGYFN